ncbi:MAG: hypothetical protein IH820_11715 [Bacteroidetes bacterium]|nr:hypothetical protein [Bacteroidota bacterium]
MKRYAAWMIALLLSASLTSGCSQQSPVSQPEASFQPDMTPMERLPDTRAGEIVRRGIDFVGGWEAWAGKRTVDYRKTTIWFESLDNEQRRLVQRHQYVLHPTMKMRIAYEDDEDRQILLINDGAQAWKWVDGQRATSQDDRNHAWNSTFGSHYVFCMPFKLTDPGARLTYDGQATLPDGTVADKVRVDYEPGAGSSGGMHVWTYYFNADDGRLVANYLHYGPEPDDYDFTEYADYQQIGDLYVPTRRHSYHSNAQAERLGKASAYVNEDVRFDAPLPDSLFVLPQ